MTAILDSMFDEINKLLKSGDNETIHDLLQQIAIDVHSVTPLAMKRQYIEKYNRLRIQVNHRIKTELLEKACIKTTEKSLAENSKQEESLKILEKAHVQLLETEEVSLQIMSNLSQQTEILKRDVEKVRGINEKVRSGDSFVTKMSRWWRG